MKPFESFIGPQFNEFITYRQNLGYSTEPVRSQLRIFDRYLKQSKIKPTVLQPAFFLELKADLKMEATSINKILYACRVFFKFLVRKGLYQQNPLQEVCPLPENAFIPFIFTPEQIDRLLDNVCGKISEHGHRKWW